jgi:hypothetical protein
MITSYDTNKIEIGKTYWSYYMSTSSKCNKIRDYCPPFQVVPIRLKIHQYGSTFDWEIIGGKFSGSMKHNINVYLNGYGTAFCEFYDTELECITGHNKRILEWSKYLNTEDRDMMYKKLINHTPSKSEIEINSIKWIKSLSPKEMEYLKWIKRYYEEEL